MTTEGLTHRLAHYAVSSRFEDLPEAVRYEAGRALLNWFGVALAGSREQAVQIAANVVGMDGSHGPASLFGQDRSASVADAAYVNCIASSVLAYDDAHLSSVAHPSGPAAAALFAVAQSRQVNGAQFLNALALGIELQCRVANMFVLPPSEFSGSFYVNGFSGPVGVAAAVGRLLGLNERAMRWALGIAATQASGFRAVHGTMTAHFRPGHATRTGVVAALLAASGFDCTENALEAGGGFLDVFAPTADPAIALADLGQHHEMLTNRYKPYPCGIVVHPTIDACLEVHSQIPKGAQISRVELTVHPATLRLTGKRAPRTTLESHVSVFHWAAAALIRGTAGLAETLDSCLKDPSIQRLREEIAAESDAELGKDEAKVEVLLTTGTKLSAHIRHARGSLDRPMTDAELSEKFHELCTPVLGASKALKLEQVCWNLSSSKDVGMAFSPFLD